MGQTVKFLLNDKPIELNNVKPTDLLIDLLRSRDINLTGTKLGCGEGGCGACTVLLVDENPETGKLQEKPINSCLRSICSLNNKGVRTIEGINHHGEKLNPVSKRLAEFNGSQCGYCSSGMVMCMNGLLAKESNPTPEQIEKQFSGNICRCTGYRAILNAMQSFADHPDAIEKANERSLLNESIDATDITRVDYPADADPYIKWYNPKNVSEALEVLNKYRRMGKSVKLVHGNTSIGIYKWIDTIEDVFINVAELDCYQKMELIENKEALKIGSGVTLSAIMDKILMLRETLPASKMKGLNALYLHMERIANHQVRNVASLAGNIMLVKNHEQEGTGEPFPSDMFTVLATLNAKVRLINSDHPDNIEEYDLLEMPEISQWPHGFFLVDFIVPLSHEAQHIRTYKISRRKQNAHAIVNAGFSVIVNDHLEIERIRIVYGGIGRIAYHDIETEAFLIGQPWHEETIQRAFESLYMGASQRIVPMPSTGIGEAFRLTLVTSLFYQFYVSVSLEIAPDSIPPQDMSAGQKIKRGVSDGSYSYLKALYSEETNTALAKASSNEFVMDKLLLEAAPEEPMIADVPALDSFIEMKLLSGLDLRKISPLEDVSVAAGDINEKYDADSEIDAYPTKLTALSQTTGEAKYTHDLHGPENTLHAGYVMSQFRNGRFEFIVNNKDLVKELQKQFPSVVAVITAADVPNKTFADIYNKSNPASYDPVFADEYVTSYGQPIALVLAKEEWDASYAVPMVHNFIKYEIDEEMPTAVTIEEALKIPDQKGIMSGSGVDGGGVNWVQRPIPEGAPGGEEKDAWLKMKNPPPVEGKINVQGTQKTGAQYHFYMEPQGTLAIPRENGQMDIFTSSQHLTACQDRVQSMLNCPANKIKAKVVRLGGGFGGKEVRPPVFAAAAGIAAYVMKKPVRLMLGRNTDMQTMGGRHPVHGDYHIVADEQGKIERLKLDFYSNAGFSTDCSVPVMDLILLSAEGSYMVPYYRTEGTVCRTNVQTRTAFRSFGLIQCSLIREEAIEKLAHKIDMLPENVRELNFYEDATLTSAPVTPYGQRLSFCRINNIWKDFKARIDFDARVQNIQKFNAQNKWKKRGISMIPIKYGISYTYRPMNQGYAYILVYSDDGTIMLHHGGIEMGQGLNTKMAQIAAEILKVDLGIINVGVSATNVIPNASSTGASTGTDLNGGAVKKACATLYNRLRKFCKEYTADPSKFPDLNQTPGKLSISADWEENWQQSWKQIISAAYTARIDLAESAFFESPNMGSLDENKQVTKNPDGSPQQIFYYYSYSVGASEVEVNILTGEHEILRTDIVYDAGKSLNPKIDVGQIEGGFMQGVGNVTTEELYYDKDGRLIPYGTWNYKPPETEDIPIDFNIYLLKYVKQEKKDGNYPPMDHYGIQSSKSTGEPPLVLASSVFFAIKHAIMDYRKSQGNNEWFELESPATIERIQQACDVRLL